MPTLQSEQLRGFIIAVARYLLAEKPESAAMLRSIEDPSRPARLREV